MASDRELGATLRALIQFMDSAPLTTTIAELEADLDGSTNKDVERLLRKRGVSPDVLHAGMLARRKFGRINDVIHATAIALALPNLLEPGEVLRRPSLGAGNDPSRPFDVETDRRVAEFKLARWDGHDAMRKRQTFKDFVHLAAEASGRSKELYVLGDRPIRFLNETRSSPAWALDRAPTTRKLFAKRFQGLSSPIPAFVSGDGKHVKVINLEDRLPKLFGAQGEL